VGQNSEVNAAEPAAVVRGRTRGVVTFGLCCRGYWSPTGIGVTVTPYLRICAGAMQLASLR